MWKNSIYFFVFSLLISPVFAYAGSYGYNSVDSYTSWEPDCYKPHPPSFFVDDIDSYNMAVHQYNSYILEVESYLQCIQGEAEEDIRKISNSISEGLSDAKDEVISEAEATKRSLEMNELLME